MLKVRFFVGLAVILILGVLFHFAYDFFNVEILKIIFPYNESIFEHLKLIVFPSIIFMIFDIIFTKDRRGIFSYYTSGIIVACVFMIASYYTYSGIIGKNIDYVNIIIFFLCVIIIMYYRMKKITLFDGANSVIAFVILMLFIEIFTFYPTDINLFSSVSCHLPNQIEFLLVHLH